MMGVLTKSPHVRDDIVDLIVRQKVPKRRHNLREPTRWPAMHNHCLPVAVRFRRRPGAVRKVRKGIWPFENRTRRGSTLSIGSMTGNAATFVYLLSIRDIRTFRVVQRLSGNK